METNGVSRAKPAVSITKKELKKARKAVKKAAKKQEKKERKDIRAAYTKALKTQSPDKMLSVIAILLTLLPIIVQYIVDIVDKKDAK